MKNKDNKKKLFIEALNNLQKIDKNIDDLIKCGIDVNSKLMSNIFSTIDIFISFLSSSYNFNQSDIEWFIYENKYGEKGMAITVEENKKKKVYKIKNSEDMYDFLFNWSKK